jgi:peptidoglycan/LPS O-acetylase OafA/YrhL
MHKIAQLQDLRGIAILMVLLVHTGDRVTPLVSHGNNGVLLFFMISGFIIASAHRHDAGFDDFVVFLKKRIARIHFPYWPIFLIFVMLFLLTGKGVAYHHDRLNIVRNLLLVHDPNQSIHPFAWTLVFEIFYYASFAAIFILARQRTPSFVLLFALPSVYNLLFTRYSQMNVIFSIYNLYFLAGVLCANYLPLNKFKTDAKIVLVLFACFQIIPFWSDSKVLLLFFTVAFFIAYLTRKQSNPVLELIGNASYSIYLFHAIVLSVGKYVITDEMARFVIFFPLSLASGYLYYRYAERYLTNLGKRLLHVPKSSRTAHQSAAAQNLSESPVMA